MILKLSLVMSVVFMLVMNTLANALPLGGQSTGAISARYPTLFTPAGITFSIWSVIYLLIISSTVSLLLTEVMSDALRGLTLVLIVSSVLNGLWIVAWHYDRLGLSVMIMMLLLLSLIYAVHQGWLFSTLHTWTLGVYLGWISVAFIANITVFLYARWTTLWPFSELVWLIIILGVGGVIAGLTLYFTRLVPFGLVFLWAYGGIAWRYVNTIHEQRTLILSVLLPFMMVLCLLTLFAFILQQNPT